MPYGIRAIPPSDFEMVNSGPPQTLTWLTAYQLHIL